MVKKYKIPFSVCLLAVCLLAGCRVNRPDGVLAPRDMERMLYDYHLAQSVAMSMPAAERFKTPAIMDWAFEKNGVDSASFNRSLEWYTRYPKEFAKIYKRLGQRIETEYKQASNEISRREHKAFGIQSGDSVSLWYLDSLMILNTSAYMNRILLNLESDSTFHPGDTVKWSSNITMVSTAHTSMQTLYVVLSAGIGDSSQVAVDSILRGCGSHRLELTLVTDDTLTLSTLRFQAICPDLYDDRSTTAILSDIDLVRYHRH